MSLDHPSELVDGQFTPAYLIGEFRGEAIYWHPPEDCLVVNKEIVQEVDTEGRTPGEYLADWVNKKGIPDMTILGEFFQSAAPYRGESVLPDRQRTVYALREIIGLEKDEVAELLDISPVTVRNHRSRAKARITIFGNVMTTIAKKNDVESISVK